MDVWSEHGRLHTAKVWVAIRALPRMRPGVSAPRRQSDIRSSCRDRPNTARAVPAFFLASDADSSYITGFILQVMGGETTGG